MKKSNSLRKKKNILYTGFGDKGTTTLFHCDQSRISKSANIIEALGALDEVNAFLGIVKVSSQKEKIDISPDAKKILLSDIINEIQQKLFIIQAEVAGSKIKVSKDKTRGLEFIIEKISEIIPPVTSFTVSGGSLLSAQLDYARTLARRAERRVVAVLEEKPRNIGISTIAYLNRLSSALFALSRYVNYFYSVAEEHPKYNKK
jgi:cob(I)alamin adenosyltransferase